MCWSRDIVEFYCLVVCEEEKSSISKERYWLAIVTVSLRMWFSVKGWGLSRAAHKLQSELQVWVLSSTCMSVCIFKLYKTLKLPQRENKFQMYFDLCQSTSSLSALLWFFCFIERLLKCHGVTLDGRWSGVIINTAFDVSLTDVMI